MTFTYDLSDNIGKVRLELGDTDSASALFTDEEIAAKLSDRSDSILLAAADLCSILARRFARSYDFATDGQSFKRSQMSAQYAALEKDLRERAGVGGGIGVATVTKVDGYSDSLSSRDGAGQANRNGRVLQGYYDPDLPY